MAWARLSDTGVFGVSLEFRCSEPLVAARFDYSQPQLKAWLNDELVCISDGAGRLQLASQDFSPIRKWLRIKGWACSDGRRLNLQWRRAQDIDAPELTLLVEPGSRTYSVWVDRSQVLQIGTSICIECQDLSGIAQHSAEMIGLLAYTWAMFERDRRATA